MIPRGIKSFEGDEGEHLTCLNLRFGPQTKKQQVTVRQPGLIWRKDLMRGLVNYQGDQLVIDVKDWFEVQGSRSLDLPFSNWSRFPWINRTKNWGDICWQETEPMMKLDYQREKRSEWLAAADRIKNDMANERVPSVRAKVPHLTPWSK
ncbi:MAG: hypothetical protein AB1489_31155 [Acidobacteriota bacterium]